MKKKVDLSVKIGNKIQLKNPVITASGTFGYGLEFSDFFDLNLLGGIVVKGLSYTPSKGNSMPRIYETPSGMLNAIGLQNIGVKAFLQEKLPKLRAYNTNIFANFYGYSVEEYVKTAVMLDEASGISGLEINISCPNIKMGGIAFGSSPDAAYRVVKEVKSRIHLPLIVKLSPNVSDIGAIAKSVEDAGADAISLINTLQGMAIDIKTRRPRLANVTGGLSGPAIKPVALKMVWQASQSVSIPVIGMGGIITGEDAIEFLIAGAAAVMVGTANFISPDWSLKILEEITTFCKDNDISSIAELTGSIKV